MAEPIRVAVSGAAGRISYSLIFRIAAGGLFGPEQPVHLCLLDLPEMRSLLEANRLELFDCAFPLLSGVEIGDDPRVLFRNAHWIILLGVAPVPAENQNRAELIRRNAPIFVEQGHAISDVSPNARILVVSNPCNTLCRIARYCARDVPSEYWFAMTRLDWMRATALLADKAGVPVTQVSRVSIWGNHSESVYPDFNNAWIGDRPAPDVITDRDWVRNVFEATVSNRSNQIHKLRQSSPAATAAQAILGTIRSIITPTPYERFFPAAVFSDGSHGVPAGLVFGFPLYTVDGKTWKIHQHVFLDDHAQERIAANIAELQHEAGIAEEFIRRF